MHIAISAEPLVHARTGLGHFVLSAVRELQKARPDWKFTLVHTSEFRELNDLLGGGLVGVPWDTQPLVGPMASLLGSVIKSSAELRRDAAIRLWSMLPSARLRSWGGHLPSIWQGLTSVDAVWAPFHVVNHQRFSLHRNLTGLSYPRVMTIHDLHPLIFPYEHSAEHVADFRDQFCGFARQADLVITQTRFQQEAIIEHIGIPESRIAIVPYPPLLKSDSLLPQISPRQIEERIGVLGIKGDYLFYPSSQTRTHKNHIRLFLAWKNLLERLGEACPMLVCTETEPYGAMIHGLLSSLGLEGKVHFTGGVSDQDLSCLYARSRAVIVPSLYEGGGGGPLTEAVLAGRPVLASRIRPFEEQAAHFAFKTVRWFSPYSVDDIADTVADFLNQKNDPRVKSEQARMLDLEAELWGSWAESYATHFESLSYSHGP